MKGKRSEWEMDSAIKLRLMKNVVPQPVIDWIQIKKKLNTVQQSICQILKHLVELTGLNKFLLKSINFFLESSASF